jgi:hypothetical protein
VSILLPPQIQVSHQNQPLLEGYLRAKLNNKKVTLGQSFIALFKGQEASFTVDDIDGLQASLPSERGGKEPQ